MSTTLLRFRYYRLFTVNNLFVGNNLEFNNISTTDTSNKLIYKNLHNVLSVLKSNKIYCFGDVINNNIHLINTIIKNADSYKRTLLHDYILRLKNEDLLKFDKKIRQYYIVSTASLEIR